MDVVIITGTCSALWSLPTQSRDIANLLVRAGRAIAFFGIFVLSQWLYNIYLAAGAGKQLRGSP